MKIGIHITHEAVQKIGGIGSVIAGLLTTDAYDTFFGQSLLYGPLFNVEGALTSRLGKDGTVLYSGIDNYDAVNLAYRFKPIEKKYNIKIVYGKRIITNETNLHISRNIDTVLLYINDMNKKYIDQFKFMLWETFKLESHNFNDWDFEQYIRIAVPYIDILHSLYPEDIQYFHFSHEYMGMAALLRIIIEQNKNKQIDDKTIFYAHEVSTVRSIVENNTGHDTMFYNVMYHPELKNRPFESIFGRQTHNYRHELVMRVEYVDHIFAVSDLINDELKFLNPQIDPSKIITVYNGISKHPINMKQKKASKCILQEYCKTLFAYKPDVILTHVTRLVSSKGLWRDIMLLEALDELFYQKGITGSYLLLSTLIGVGRPDRDIFEMEESYGWPVMHKKGWPDLVGIESVIYEKLLYFNAKSKAIKGVFINQFGFNRHRCGNRIPENAQWVDLRIGSDVELGMSVYEPFGIAQIETIQFGGIAVLSAACGASSLINKAYSSEQNSFHVIDFSKVSEKYTIEQFLNMSGESRVEIEEKIISDHSEIIFKKIDSVLDNKKLTNLLKSSQKNAQFIDWEYIVSNYIIPAIT